MLSQSFINQSNLPLLSTPISHITLSEGCQEEENFQSQKLLELVWGQSNFLILFCILEKDGAAKCLLNKRWVKWLKFTSVSLCRGEKRESEEQRATNPYWDKDIIQLKEDLMGFGMTVWWIKVLEVQVWGPEFSSLVPTLKTAACKPSTGSEGCCVKLWEDPQGIWTSYPRWKEQASGSVRDWRQSGIEKDTQHPFMVCVCACVSESTCTDTCTNRCATQT